MKLYKEVKCSDRLPEESVPINTTHGLTNTRLYNTWDTMKARCYRQNNKCFPMYGGAGIKVCDEWINNPKAFIDYCMTLEGWDDKSLSLDRIDPYGNYEPGNIRFTTPAIQSRNQRKRKGNNPFTGVEDGVEFSKPYELPTEEEMVKVIRAWDDYYLAYDDEYPAMEAHKALAKAITAITNLLKEKS